MGYIGSFCLMAIMTILSVVPQQVYGTSQADLDRHARNSCWTVCEGHGRSDCEKMCGGPRIS